MRWAIVLGVVLLSAGLAGCAGSDDGASEAKAPNAESDETAAIEAPSWSVGDRWTWSSDQVGEVTYIVTGQKGGDWIVDTTNRDVAFFDARFDVSTLGEIRKDDLAGSQGDRRVQFFDWPLEANETWTTTWDGVQREITVDRVEAGTAYLTARQDGRVAVEYTYDSQAESFGQLTFLDENGTAYFGMQLQSSGSNASQPAVRWQLDQPLDREGSFGAEPVSWGFSFEVGDNVTDLWLDLAIACPSGTFQFGFGNDRDGYGVQQQCPAEVEETGPVVEDPSPGTYDGGFTGSSPDGEGTYSSTLYVRTLQEIPAGEG